MEAYRHYFRGLERSARLGDDGALEEFKAAVAIEPRFALAELEIAQLDSLYGRNGDPAFQRASAHAETLPVKERELVRAQVASSAGRRAEAVAILEPLALRFLDDRFIAFAAGEAAGCPEGLPRRRRALALAPDWDRARVHLLYCLMWQGRAEEAIAEAEAAERARPTSSSAAAVALAHYETGNVDGAIDAARRAAERGHTNWNRGVLISALATRGDFAGALALLPAEDRVLGDLQLYYRGIYASELGRDAEAIAAFAQLEKRSLSYFANVYRAFLLARGRYLTSRSSPR